MTASGGTTVRAGSLDVIFNRPLDFAMGQPAPAARPDVARIACGSGVRLESTSTTDDGSRSVEKLALLDMVVDQDPDGQIMTALQHLLHAAEVSDSPAPPNVPTEFRLYFAENIREKKTQLDGLWRLLDGAYWAYAQAPAGGAGTAKAGAELLPLASGAGDLQYSIQFQERVRKLFTGWLSAHIAFSIVFYLLLALHIWAGIYFGLRWFR